VRVASRIADFNYKVALASGLKSLQGGRLRQAEEQFLYLVQKFPSCDGGYRGLAKVLIEEDDRTAALRILLDGGYQIAQVTPVDQFLFSTHVEVVARFQRRRERRKRGGL